jgi:cardiolipin synthase
MELVPNWLTVLVLCRDVFLLVGYFFLFVFTGEWIEVRPSVFGKVTTFFQLASVTIVLVSVSYPDAIPPPVRTSLFVAAGTFTALSGLQYMGRGLHWLSVRDADA